MRKARKTTFTVVFCAAACAANHVLADPASMVFKQPNANQETSSSIWPWSKKTQPAVAGPQQAYGQPVEKPSPIRHPIEYWKSVKNGKNASAPRPEMQPAPQTKDAISLNTPIGPPTPEFFIVSAQMCERQGDIQQARNNFQRALTMWPGHVEVLRAAARMEDRVGNLPLAENLYGQAVKSNPQHAGALNDLGLCLARQGKLQPSVQMLEQAVQLQPTKALYRNNAATVLVEMHQDQRALAHLAAVHGAAEANYNLGQLLVERGRGGDAAPYFQAALQQDPNMQPAAEALARLQSTHMAAATPQKVTKPAAPQVVNVSPAPQAAAPITPIAAQPNVAAAPVAALATQPQYPTTPATTPVAATVAPAPPVAPPSPVAPVAQQPNYAATVPQQATVNPAPAVTPQYLPPVASRPGTPGAIIR